MLLHAAIIFVNSPLISLNELAHEFAKESVRMNVL